MRSDMQKVMCEAPRWGACAKNHKFGTRLKFIPDHDYEDQPMKSRGFESRNGYGKISRTNEQPLSRFVRSNLGRPWDEVYSELCAKIDKRGATGYRVMHYLRAMVTTGCYFGADGAIYGTWHTQRVQGFYVHPCTGLLCEAPRESQRERKRRVMEAEEVTWLYAGGKIGYRKHQGLWYRVTLQRIRVNASRRKGEPVIRDIFLKTNVSLPSGEHWIAVEKKQCSRRELVKVRALLWMRERNIQNI
jgi:hypothetical protein